MNRKQILFIIFTIIWTISVLAQHIYWISDGNYNIAAFIWAIIELSIPYITYKILTDEH